MFDKIYRHRKLFLLLVLIPVVFSSYFLSYLKLDNSFDIWFVEDDPVLQQYNEFISMFGNDEIVITSVTGSSPIINEDIFRKLRELEIQLLDIDGVERVTSLYQVVQIAQAQSDLKKIRWLVRNTTTAKRFCTEDLSTLFIYTTLQRSKFIDIKRPEILSQIDSLITIRFEQQKVRHTGTGVILNALNQTIMEQSIIYVPIAYLLILLIAYYYIRSLRWIMLIVATVLSVNLIVFAVMAVSDQPLTMITIAIPLLILIVTVANIMHYARALNKGQNLNPADRKKSFTGILKPSFFNALTTSGGFLSLVLASMPITRNYGAFAALGVSVSFLLSTLFSMFLITTIPDRRNNFKEHFLTRMWVKIKNRPYVVISFFSVFFLLTIPGFFYLNVDTNSLEFLPDGNRVKTDSKIMEKSSGNYLPLDFIIVTEKKNEWRDPDFLQRLRTAGMMVVKNSAADAFYSIAQVVYDLQKLSAYPGQLEASNKNIKAAVITADLSGAANRFVQDDKLRVTCLVPIGSAGELSGYGRQIMTEMQEILGHNYVFQQTGYLPMYNRLIDYLIEDQLKSLTMAFVVILLLMFIFLRSFKMLFIATTVNILPVLAVFAFMGYWKIDLDVATITVVPAMLGIIVDDTLHLLYKIKQKTDLKKEISLTITEILQETGAALLATSIVLAAGFAVLIFAPVSSIANTGLLIVITTLLAIITDILLLPILVHVLYQKP